MFKWMATMLHRKPGTYSGTIVMLNPLSVWAQTPASSLSRLLYFSCISQTVFSFWKKIFLYKYPLIWHSFNQWPWSFWRTYCFLEWGQILLNCTQASKNWRRKRPEKSVCIQVNNWYSTLIILIWRSIIRTSYSAHSSMLNTRNKQMHFLKSKQCRCHILSTTITLYFSCSQNIYMLSMWSKHAKLGWFPCFYKHKKVWGKKKIRWSLLLWYHI